jgi:hypothetical protein
MKNQFQFCLSLLSLALAAMTLVPARLQAAAEPIPGLTESRRDYLAERQALVAEALQLTSAERAAFLPVYRQYQARREALADEFIKLVLEYADAYPNVTELRARDLLKHYTALEQKLADQRAAQLKKAAKALPATKALRWAQLENRMDLQLRQQLASVIPLLPIEGELTGELTGAVALTRGEAGGTAVRTYELRATVVALDPQTRRLSLMSADGIKQTVRVGPEAANFAQLREGDELVVTLTEELAVAVVGAGEAAADQSAGLVALAPVGAKPGGVLAGTRQLTATITALDPAKRQATLQFGDGTVKTVTVRPDVDLTPRKVGDQVVIRLTESLALRVRKP